MVGHDVGGALMQPLARQAPARVAGLFFFDFVYPGIGPRMAEPDRLNNIWYQSFHQMEMAPHLIGASRETCRPISATFCERGRIASTPSTTCWNSSPTIFSKPGNLAGGFAHYRAAHAGRVRMMKGEVTRLPPIDVPTCVRWAEHDPLFPNAWTDKLGETFSNLDLADVSRRRTFRASRGSRSRVRRDRGVLHTHRLDLKDKRWGRQTRQNTDGPVPLHRNSGGEVRLRQPDGSDEMTVATQAETATRTGF